jgi:hypothetical protein
MGDENNYGQLQNPGSAYGHNQHPSSPYAGNAGLTKPITAKLTAVVGERISLDATKLMGIPIEAIAWNVPQGAIKKYYHTLKVGQVVSLDAADKTKPLLEFYWTEAGNKLVTATVTYNWAGQSFTINYQWNFDIAAPVLVRLNAKTSKPTLWKAKKAWHLKFQKGNDPGIAWDWEVTAPAASAGFIKDLQIVKPGGRVKQQKIPGQSGTNISVYRSTLGNANILDDDPREGKTGRQEPGYHIPFADNPLKVEAGKSIAKSGIGDSPGTDPEPIDFHISVKEEFIYFLLFKPLKPGSIWVPVGKAEWYWQAEAVKAGENWKLKSASGSLSSNGQPTTDLPVWEGNTLQHKWLPPK